MKNGEYTTSNIFRYIANLKWVEGMWKTYLYIFFLLIHNVNKTLLLFTQCSNGIRQRYLVNSKFGQELTERLT